VAAARVVQGHEELMMISAGGIVIRTPLETISERAGRATSGVILMNLREGDRLAAIALLEPSPNGNGDTPEDAAVVVDELDEDVRAALPTPSSVDEEEPEDKDDPPDEDEDEGEDKER
jgi:hypothetical protein